MSINEECLPENYSSFFYRDLYRRFPRTFIVVEVDGDIQGYIMCRIETGLSKLKILKPTRMSHVVSLAVREPYRRMGIATSILKEMLKQSREEYGATECYLEVRVGNAPAVHLYNKMGFKKVKRNYGYYMDGEDAWIMAISLEEDT